MQVLLVRHAAAAPKAVDPERGITVQGREQARRVAVFLDRSGWRCGRVYHSGKLRASQTAQVLGQMAFAVKPEPRDGLAPNDPVEPVAEWLAGGGEDVALVGHLPFLERLAGLLLRGDPDTKPVLFPEVGALCLARRGDEWQVRWMVVPALLPE